jgi:hypothetical protein
MTWEEGGESKGSSSLFTWLASTLKRSPVGWFRRHNAHAERVIRVAGPDTFAAHPRVETQACKGG